MLFRFHDFNHCPQGKIAIADIVAILASQLRALGHEAYLPVPTDWPRSPVEFEMGADRINVLLEAFTDPGCVETIRAAHSAGSRFVYVATEEPSPLGFNMGNAWGMIDRQEIFPEAARYADAILHLTRGNATTAWYARHAPSAFVELGYAPNLVYRGPAIEPDHDFGFYGQTTPRRERVFARLRDRGTLLTEHRLLLPREERDAMFRRARVIVTVRAQDNVEFVSSTRCATALFLGRPVIAEPHNVRAGWDEVVRFAADYLPFYDDAAYAARHWREIHAAQLARFERVFPPEECLGRALVATGLVP